MYKKSALTSMRRISDGITTTSESRFILPPLSTSSHTMLPSSSSHIKKEYSTFSYSYPQQAEDYYYPVYQKHEWSEDESFVENHKMKRKREMDDRIQEINREFLENREVLYGEKIKHLQDELIAVETGHHDLFHASIMDLEHHRRETIHNARLMMIYQISTVDKEYHLNSKQVHEDSIAERKEIQNALFSIIEEKRRKLKEDKDGEGDSDGQHQTRHRKRLLRKRGDLEYTSPLSANQKKKQDRLKENPSHLIGVLTHRVEEEIEADYYEMTRKK